MSDYELDCDPVTLDAPRRRLRGRIVSKTTAPSVWLCRACHFGHFNECVNERCQSMRLEDRHE